MEMEERKGEDLGVVELKNKLKRGRKYDMEWIEGEWLRLKRVLGRVHYARLDRFGQPKVFGLAFLGNFEK